MLCFSGEESIPRFSEVWIQRREHPILASVWGTQTGAEPRRCRREGKTHIRRLHLNIIPERGKCLHFHYVVVWNPVFLSGICFYFFIGSSLQRRVASSTLPVVFLLLFYPLVTRPLFHIHQHSSPSFFLFTSVPPSTTVLCKQFLLYMWSIQLSSHEDFLLLFPDQYFRIAHPINPFDLHSSSETYFKSYGICIIN